MAIDGFDWDHGNREKCSKHGVSLDDVEALFRGRPGVAPDIGHSDVEDRFIAAGRTHTGRALFVAFTFRTLRGRTLVRPISARYMHAKEADRYAASAKAEDR